MSPSIFIIAILGCGEVEAPCEQVRFADARYEGRDACVAATADEVSRHSDIPYPVVVAQCLPEGETAEMLPGDEVELPEPEENPAYPAARD